MARVWTRALQPVDAAGLAAFRVLIGLVFALSAFRFLANGWIERFFVQPDTYFTYMGFEWVQPLAPWAMHALFWAIAILGLMVAAGAFYRVSAALLFLAFGYVELIDVTNYLNHYYLLSLLSALMVVLPLHRHASVDARRRPDIASETLPAWVRWLLMFQVGCVYFYAGLAKATEDWLIHAQPLNIWLSARTDVPLIGPLLGEVWVAHAFSWGGFLHDLLIVPALLWRRTRLMAYAVLVTFHIAVGVLFNIGLFPVIMISAATIFLPAHWPRAVWRRLRGERLEQAPDAQAVAIQAPRWSGVARWATVGVALWCAVQVLMPLRTHLYGGNVIWHEQGMRWSWRVMLREKNGAVSYRVKLGPDARERRVPPSKYLTDHQEREMSGQPDLILQLAHRIRDDYRAAGHSRVEVRVDALVSLNGRRARPLIDPTVDLAAVEDSVLAADWITPAPDEPPPTLKPVGSLAKAIGQR